MRGIIIIAFEQEEKKARHRIQSIGELDITHTHTH